jgi:hypothetical protein
VALATSPDLPPSIFDKNEELFGTSEREALMKELGFGLQAGFAPTKPVIEFSLADGSLRYNRIEGLSAGVSAYEDLGEGYRVSASARLGVADWQPNASLGITRSTGQRSLSLQLYRQLAVASDWGQPLAFGASFANLLYGRDEGFYYRALGASLTYRTEPNGATEWRLFAERQDSARVSARGWLTGSGFAPNVQARAGAIAGLAVADHRSAGLDPRGWRLLTDTKLEGGVGDWSYARGLVDATLSKGFLDQGAIAITAAGGTSAGTVPPQRKFFLGSLQTVRGQVAGAQQGNAFWFARNEVGYGTSLARPSVYYDVGWAGDRSQFSTPGTLMQGVGVGASFLDGLFRLDLARGLKPTPRWRLDLSVEARF